jgi:hypothetical protein
LRSHPLTLSLAGNFYKPSLEEPARLRRIQFPTGELKWLHHLLAPVLWTYRFDILDDTAVLQSPNVCYRTVHDRTRHSLLVSVLDVVCKSSTNPDVHGPLIFRA